MSSAISIPATPSVRPSSQPGAIRGHGDPCTLIILGATGDLTRRKLMPAIYNLVKSWLVAPQFAVLCSDRVPLDDAGYRAQMREAVMQSKEIDGFDESAWAAFAEHVFYVQGDLTADAAYAALRERLGVIERRFAPGENNRLFYLAVPPVVFEPIVTHLSASGLAPRSDRAKDKPWVHVIVEKPFGHSLATARALNKLVLDRFGEHQVYRIDHYLAKEKVQNILVLRSGNMIFEPLWNRQYVSHVQITAAETVGVEQRGGYYERAGVVRDMFQNHLFQLLALTAMELPSKMSADAVRDEKVKLLRAVRPLDATPNGSVRAQYAAGEVGGKALAGYREEPNVAPASATPTYAALRIMIDNYRWKGVPFYLRSGKRMARRVSEIAITFRTPPHVIFSPGVGQSIEPNVLVMRVQPNDGIAFRFEVKTPGAHLELTPEVEVSPVEMDFSYAQAFGADVHPAYSTLLLDAMIGDATLFTRSDEVEVAWKLTDPMLDFWEKNPLDPMPTYAAGSWGPAEADDLLARDGFRWRTP